MGLGWDSFNERMFLEGRSYPRVYEENNLKFIFEFGKFLPNKRTNVLIFGETK